MGDELGSWAIALVIIIAVGVAGMVIGSAIGF